MECALIIEENVVGIHWCRGQPCLRKTQHEVHEILAFEPRGKLGGHP